MVVCRLTVNCLLGADFLTMHKATTDCAKGCLTLALKEVSFITTTTKALSSCTQQQSTASETSDHVCLVTVSHTVDIKSRSVEFVRAQLLGPQSTFPLIEVLFEPNNSSSIPKHNL